MSWTNTLNVISFQKPYFKKEKERKEILWNLFLMRQLTNKNDVKGSLLNKN